MTDREAFVAFNLTDHIGSVRVSELAARHGSVAAAWEAFPDKTARTGREVDWHAEFATARRFGVTILTPADEEYPKKLMAVRGHPLALYVKGSVKALSMPSIAMVGTRRATDYGLDQANRFAHALAADGWCIVSGLAVGIDGESHRGALDAGGITVGILGSALDRFYPAENRALAREMVAKGGAVISEFPFGREPDQQTFPQRNHVVAALADGLLAVESPSKSGTLITTSIAADLGRTVMAIPGRVDSRSSSGCLQLIRDGATLVRCPEDVNEALGSLKLIAAPKKTDLAKGMDDESRGLRSDDGCTIEEALVMRHIQAEGIPLDRLVELSGLDAGKVNAIAMTLRIKGRIRFLPGNRVALPRGAEA